MIGRLSALILSGALLASFVTPACRLYAQEQLEPEQVQFFEQHIRPVLVKECYTCHSAGAKEIEGGLTLDTRAGIRKGGDRGPAVVPGNVRRSLLLEAIRHTDDDVQMPPEKKLPPDVIADFETWIAMGGARSSRWRGTGCASVWN